MMKKHIRNLIILISPFLLMVTTNEAIRPTIVEPPYSKNGMTAINSADESIEKCSWICHNNTNYCKKHHVKQLKTYYADIIYFGIISSLAKTGYYGLANIVFLVVLLPLLIWIFMIKSLNIQDEINDRINKL